MKQVGFKTTVIARAIRVTDRQFIEFSFGTRLFCTLLMLSIASVLQTLVQGIDNR